MTKKAAKSKPKQQVQKTTRLVVLYGLDDTGAPRGAKFIEPDEALLSRLAQALRLRIGIAAGGGKHSDTLGEIPLGRVYATGKGSVPNINQDLYDKLNALVGGDPGPISKALPKTWDDVAAGALVIAQESLTDGWFEAIVTARDGDTLTLKFRDYPSQPEITRPLTAVALLKHD